MQDTASANVAISYTATLLNTAAILGALRRARAALDKVADGNQPAQLSLQTVQPLYGQAGGRISSLSLSPDSQFLAVAYEGQEQPCCGLVIYQLNVNMLLCSSCADRATNYMVQWSPCSRWLSVATTQQVTERLSMCSLARHCTMPWAMASRSAPSEGALMPPGATINWDGLGAWSPDGALFMYLCGKEESPGCLHIRDVVRSIMLAQVSLLHLGSKGIVMDSFQGTLGWHPSSRGITHAGGSCSMPRPSALHHAGFAIGALATPFHSTLTAESWSSTGDMLLATDTCTGHWVILACSVLGHEYDFDLLHTLGHGDKERPCWAPQPSQQACMMLQAHNKIRFDRFGHAAAISIFAAVCEAPKTAGPASVTFSPSGEQVIVTQRSSWHPGQCRSMLIDAHRPVDVSKAARGVRHLPRIEKQLVLWTPCGSRLVVADELFQWDESPVQVFHFDPASSVA